MQTSTAFDKIKIDSANRQRSKFGLAHDVNTTASIGDTQPIACRLLIPKSKTTLSMRHLVRLAPMVVPTYTRLKAKCWSQFVGMSDLLPRSVPAMLAKTPISVATAAGYPQIPKELPNMPLCDIASMCLVGASFTVYVFRPRGEGATADDLSTTWEAPFSNDDTSEVTDLKDWLIQNLRFGGLSGFPGYEGAKMNLRGILGNQFYDGMYIPINCSGADSVGTAANRFFVDMTSQSTEVSWSYVPLNSADFVFRRSIQPNNVGYEIAIACRLSAFGKRMRKILIGLGYQPNFAVSEPVCALPLFAYYKAWFDVFGLTLYDNWESSAACSLLTSWDNNVRNQLNWDNVFFRQFVYDLGTTFVTETQDYISAHQIADAIKAAGSDAYSERNRGFVNNIILQAPAGSNNGIAGIEESNNNMTDAVYSDTRHVYINRVQHTEVDAELLKILYKWTNRETIAGKRIKELLEAGGYGDYVKNCKSNFIGYEELDIDVTDVNATADSTNDVTGHNSVVGEYVGKGVGVTDGKKNVSKTLSYETDEFGYWITLFAIAPESGYCQGLDQILLDYDADHLYNPDFDGVGMELEPKTLLLGSEDWVSRSDSDAFLASFGVVPRHSKYKVQLNKMNGDFSLRSSRSSYQPYVMDKVLSFGDRMCKQGTYANQFSAIKGADVSEIPVAGLSWRYLNRYFWLNNFERIFTSFESNDELFLRYVRDMSNVTNYELYYALSDHFVCMNVMDMVTYAPMLPISESYGTTDENDGHADATYTKA